MEKEEKYYNYFCQLNKKSRLCDKSACQLWSENNNKCSITVIADNINKLNNIINNDNND